MAVGQEVFEVYDGFLGRAHWYRLSDIDEIMTDDKLPIMARSNFQIIRFRTSRAGREDGHQGSACKRSSYQSQTQGPEQ